MVPPVRHNFTAAVRSRLAASSGHGCCKPDCRAVTFCARDNGSIYPIGQAGHITGAAPGGPRYDANMTADERESDEKGLWLCGNCHKMVDSDHNSFSVDCLRQWKSDASKNTREALGRPNTVINTNKYCLHGSTIGICTTYVQHEAQFHQCSHAWLTLSCLQWHEVSVADEQ